MKKPKSNAPYQANQFTIIILLVILVMLGLALWLHSSSNKPIATSSVSSGSSQAIIPNLSLSPSNQRVASGSNLTLEILANIGTTPVNAVQANLTYPSDKLTFVSVDGSTSAFGISAQSTGSNGQVYVARGNISPLTGKVVVAKVIFTVKSSSGNALLSFSKGSALVSSKSNTNILRTTYGGNYTL